MTFLPTPSDMWDLSSPARDRTHPCPLHWEHGVLTTGPSGKSLNLTFICIGKPENSSDICFIAVVWNKTHNISKVCL